MHTGNLVLNILGVSPISCSHKAGTPDQDLIRVDWEFLGVQPISLHTQKIPIHKGISPTGCTMTASRNHLNMLATFLVQKKSVNSIRLHHMTPANLAVSFHSISCPSTASSSSSSVKSWGGGGPSSSSPRINLILSAGETGAKMSKSEINIVYLTQTGL